MAEREIDLFYAGSDTMYVRRKIRPLEEELKRRGLNVVWLREKVPFEKFVEYLKNSKVVLSPEGAGWHCFRHYEALAAGAVPVINRPEDGLYTDIVEGKTAWFYDDVEDAARIVEEVVRDDRSLAMNLQQCMDFAKQHHYTQMGERIIRELVDEKTTEQEVE